MISNYLTLFREGRGGVFEGGPKKVVYPCMRGGGGVKIDKNYNIRN